MLAAASARAEPSIRLLADGCAMCHGTDGRSPGPLDSLAGESADELLEEMMDFKTEPGEGRIMSVLVKGYSEAQLRALADYFAALPR
jgi:cytochrome c553